MELTKKEAKTMQELFALVDAMTTSQMKIFWCKITKKIKGAGLTAPAKIDFIYTSILEYIEINYAVTAELASLVHNELNRINNK